MISFIVPAHNEEVLLERTLAALRASAADDEHEIVVVDDASTDRTAAIAAAAGARVVASDRRQISAARNAGAAQARGDLLVFVDADTVISRAVVVEMLAAVRAGACAGGAPVRLDEPAPAYAKAMMRALLFGFRHLRMACGCFLFATRRAFAATDGFDERVYASEEIGMSRALGRQGSFVTLRSPVVTSARKVRTYSFLEIMGTMLVLALGPSSLRNRSRLSLWYGERRADPASPAGARADPTRGAPPPAREPLGDAPPGGPD